MPKVMELIIPDNAEDLQEVLNDDAKVHALMRDPVKMREFIAGYAEEVHAKDPDLIAQAKEAVNEGLNDYMATEGFKKKDGIPPRPGACPTG